MLHGYLASSNYYKHIAKRLEDDYTIVRVDLLGHGRSPKPRHIDYSYDDQLGALRRTLAHLAVETPHALVGHSMGALLALRYTTTYPSDVTRLILLNPPMFSSAEEAHRDIAATGRHYRAFLLSRFQSIFWGAVRIVPRSPHRTRHAVSLSDILAVPRVAREGSLHQVVMQGNVFEEVERLTLPTMIVVGQKDRRIYIKNAMRHTWPAHVTLKINQYGHNGMAYHPSFAERYIRAHLL